ncbi:MAG: 2-oxoacid:acceptor oxidoreductase family protein [bacterium]
MKKEIIIAGFGGQGVLSMGKILSYAALLEGKEVTWMPAYGPEQRGGTANVTVILSDTPISSPILQKFDIVVVLNQPSMDKFEPRVKPGGVLIFDPNGMTRVPERKDIDVYRIPATDTATQLGQAKTFNMFVLGGMLKVDPMVDFDNVMLGLKKSLPERHHKLLPANEAAMIKGGEIIEKL